MNPIWKQYLSNLNALFSTTGDVTFNLQANVVESKGFVTPIAHLAVLRVSGQDATSFLQGQSTCNLLELDDKRSSFGAFCNAKGRVVSTFIILKQQQDWLLILPTALLSSIQKRLQLYILRSKVQLSDASEEFCLLGLSRLPADHTPFELPQAHLATLTQNTISLRLGIHEPRYLILADALGAQQLWATLVQQGFSPQNTSEWSLQDIQAGIPWLNANTSEVYIPQMLNLDHLGGISFNKGCYTGQEVVARTHYLGKAKRALYKATASVNGSTPQLGCNILDASDGQVVGTVLTTHLNNNTLCTLLVVLATDALTAKVLTLQEQPSIIIHVENPEQ